jgi:signal transduction histidine kinase
VTRRLLLSYVSLALLVLVLLEAPLAVLIYRYERGLAASQAERVATGVAIAASEDFEQGRTADLQSVTARYHQETGGEVEIVGSHGQEVADSDSDHDNDAAGPDHRLVVAALAGSSVSQIVTDEGQPQAVAAVPIGDGGDHEGAVLLGLPAQETTERIHHFWLILAGFATVILILTAGLGACMARSLTRPLERLKDAVDDLGRVSLEARARTDQGPPEIRELARQFNEMASRLTELVDAQTRFVADASHQLRSPLTALRLRLENLEIATSGPSAGTVAAAGREVQRLSRLVDGLLTLGQADRIQPDRAAVDLAEVIDERCRAWAAYADERHIVLEQVTEAAGRPQVRMVPGDLEQILDNLLANALDASPAGTTIWARITGAGPQELEVHVVDQGPGMSESERQHAFDRFWQGPGRRGGHSGLGLAIVRQLAVRNQLDVELRPAPAGGLDAVVSLPATATIDLSPRRPPAPIPG